MEKQNVAAFVKTRMAGKEVAVPRFHKRGYGV